MDFLFIEHLTVMAIVGVSDWEQKCVQKLVLDLKLAYSVKLAARNDDIIDCLNYTDVSDAVLCFIKNNTFFLIERVAEEVANLLIDRFRLTWIQVKVSKPGAIPQATNVGVVIERGTLTP